MKLFFSLLKYLGSVEVLCSMKTLDFESRTRVARESIRLVCAAVGVALRERRKVIISLGCFFLAKNFDDFSRRINFPMNIQ